MSEVPSKHIAPMNKQLSDEIMLDYDEEYEILHFIQRYRFIFERVHIPVKDISIVRSKGGGWHIRVKLKVMLDPLTIIALQCILGSDWRRETFNMVRVLWTRIEHWNVLFQGREVKEEPSHRNEHLRYRRASFAG